MTLKPAAAALLILTASCSSPAPDIQALLAEPEIDVRRLDEIFAVETGDLRLAVPQVDPIGFAAPPDEWALTNVGERPVWLLNADLRIKVEFVPFLPPDEPYGGRFFGGRTSLQPSRPAFHLEEWTCLQPGDSLTLKAPPAPEHPGLYTYSVTLRRSGDDLCWKARSFNAGRPLVRPESHSTPLLTARREKLVLPPRTTSGAPWHQHFPIELHRTNDRRFFLSTRLGEAKEAPGYLDLEAFVMNEAGQLAYRGPLRGVTQSTFLTASLDLRVDSTYEFPHPLPPGRYRILVRVLDAESWFLSGPTRVRHACDAPPGAHTRWVQFSEP